MSILNLNAENFDTTVKNSEKPVLVDFFATWCGPCMMMAPVIDALAEKNNDVLFCKVDVDECPPLATRFGIQYIPALALFKNGELVCMESGFHTEEQIAKMLS